MIKTRAVDISIQAISPVLKLGWPEFLNSTDGKRKVNVRIIRITKNGKYRFMEYIRIALKTA
jgi:hypothetical protein